MNGVSLEEFNSEWGGIYGFFEIRINSRIIGFCPNRKILLGEEGNEDILYWLLKLSDGIVQLNDGKEYEIQLLSMNKAKLVIKNEDKLMVNFVNVDTEEIIWLEKITYHEWFDEVMLNIEKFIEEIKNNNIVITHANNIQKLVKIKETAVFIDL